MPRTFTGPQRTLLASREYDFHSRASIQRDDGVWQDFGNLAGYDWLNGARWSDGIDPPVMEGSASFHRENYDGGLQLLSLAPYMQSSALNSNDSFLYSPAIKGGRGIVLYIAYTAKGVAPVAADWIEVFDGFIHNPSWGGDDGLVVCNMRDIYGYLMAQWTESEQTYSTSGGMPYETVLQQILDANPNVKLGNVQLYTPVSPATNLRTTKVPVKPVLLALRDIAAQIGWDVKGKYDAAGKFRLTFFEPDRANTTAPDFVLGPDEYWTMDAMEWPTDDIRNKIEARSFDALTGAPIVSIAEDAASQAEYGTQYMRVGDNFANNIDSQTELDALTAAVLADLSRPFATQKLSAPFIWFAQTGDLAGIAPNMVEHDTQLNLGITQIDFEIGSGEGSCAISLREQVAGYVKEWLKKADPGGPQATLPPTITGRFTTDADWLGTIYLTPSSPTKEKMEIWINDNGYWGVGAPGTLMYLCASNSDPTKKFFDSDVEIDGSTAYFTDGTTIVGPLGSIVLTPGKSTTWLFQAIGQSGLKSDWTPVVMSYSAPTIASASLGLLPTGAARLQLTVTAGQNMNSVAIEIRDSPVAGFGTLLTALTYNDVITGDTLTLTYTLGPLQLIKTWYAHLTPRSGPASVGILSPIGPKIVVMEGTAYAAPTFADLDAQMLVSTAPPNVPSARVVADTTTVAADFTVAGVAKFYVPDNGITTAKIGAGQVTIPKINATGTPGITTFLRGDGTWATITAGQYPGPGGAMSVFQTVVKTTPSLANDAGATILLDIAPTVSFQNVETSAAAWIRVYDSLAALTGDISRAYGTDISWLSLYRPIWDSGNGLGSQPLSLPFRPDVVGHNNDTTRIGRFYMRVVNKSGGTAAITTTIKYLPLEGNATPAPPDVTGSSMLWRLNAQLISPAPADGTETLTIANPGSLGGNFTNVSAAGAGPKYKVNIINGHPVLRITQIGGNTRAYTPPTTGYVTPTESHIFAILKTAGGGAAWVAGGSGSGNATTFPNTAGNVTDPHASTSANTVPITNNPTSPFLYHSHGKAGLWEAFVGLTQVFTTASNTVAYGQLGVGGWLSGGFFAVVFEGDIGEWRFYSGALTSDEILGIKLQMAADWGVSI